MIHVILLLVAKMHFVIMVNARVHLNIQKDLLIKAVDPNVLQIMIATEIWHALEQNVLILVLVSALLVLFVKLIIISQLAPVHKVLKEIPSLNVVPMWNVCIFVR